jgi:ABC-type tungstate transport system substrate-binding protein
LNLPDFIWLWRIAAWSMGLSLTAYSLLAVSGLAIALLSRPQWSQRFPQLAGLRKHLQPWLRPLHIGLGSILVGLVLLLLCVGIVGTLGHFGSLGHSWHLPMGLSVVVLVLTSAWSASRIHPQRPWARSLHLTLNALLFFGFLGVGLTGWDVVQKYLP